MSVDCCVQTMNVCNVALKEKCFIRLSSVCKWPTFVNKLNGISLTAGLYFIPEAAASRIVHRRCVLVIMETFRRNGIWRPLVVEEGLEP